MKKITIKIILIMILLTLILPATVKAGYQANKNTRTASDDANKLFEKIRLMESETGTLGVKSNIDTTKTFLDSSNN